MCPRVVVTAGAPRGGGLQELGGNQLAALREAGFRERGVGLRAQSSGWVCERPAPVALRSALLPPAGRSAWRDGHGAGHVQVQRKGEGAGGRGVVS